MLRIDIKENELLSDTEVKNLTGHVLLNEERKQLVLHEVKADEDSVGEVYKPDGSLLLRLIKGCLPEKLCDDASHLLRTVKGSPANRPGILDKKARVPERRKDGTVSQHLGSRALINKLRKDGFQIGETDMLGPFRGKNQRTHRYECRRTGWTLRKPELYLGVLDFIHEVNDIYAKYAPTEYARQVEYVKGIPDRWKIRETAFTTLYVIKDNPTACHTDDFDIEDGFGVMATLGAFSGGELCFPKYRVVVDYRPGDVILANVHELHGNFPQLDGERVACVFFCRTDQHKCPA
jgi:hypothetical protein